MFGAWLSVVMMFMAPAVPSPCGPEVLPDYFEIVSGTIPTLGPNDGALVIPCELFPPAGPDSGLTRLGGT